MSVGRIAEEWDETKHPRLRGRFASLSGGPLLATAEALGRDHALYREMRLAHAKGESYRLPSEKVPEVLDALRPALRTAAKHRTHSQRLQAIAGGDLRRHVGERATPQAHTQPLAGGAHSVRFGGKRIGVVRRSGKQWEATGGASTDLGTHATKKAAVEAVVGALGGVATP